MVTAKYVPPLETKKNGEIAFLSEIAVFLRGSGHSISAILWHVGLGLTSCEDPYYRTWRGSPLSLVQVPLPFVSWQVHDVSLA